jgi:hypothetical protein
VKLLPTLPEVTRQALLLIAAGAVAAVILSAVPAVRDFIRENSPF